MKRTDVSLSGEKPRPPLRVRGVVPGVECGKGGRVHPATTTSAMHSIARAGKIGFMHF